MEKERLEDSVTVRVKPHVILDVVVPEEGSDFHVTMLVQLPRRSVATLALIVLFSFVNLDAVFQVTFLLHTTHLSSFVFGLSDS